MQNNVPTPKQVKARRANRRFAEMQAKKALDLRSVRTAPVLARRSETPVEK